MIRLIAFVALALGAIASTHVQAQPVGFAKSDILDVEVEGKGFGEAVAMDGHRAVVGEGRSLVEPGRVFVYASDIEGNWTQVQVLQAGQPSRGDGFGQAVDLAGDLLVVGAHTVDNTAGAVHVFRRQADDTWLEEARLQPSDSFPNQNFGEAVATDGETVMVGASASGTGAAYVFAQEAGSGAWVQQARLVGGDATEGEFHGWAVKVQGEEAFVGAQLATGGGAVYVFRRNNSGGWAEAQKLVALDTVPGDRFGFALDVDEGVLAIGAATHNGFQGGAYVFTPDETTGAWTERAKLTRTATDPDIFGNAIAVRGEELWVGARRRNNRTGAVYVYRYSGGNRWFEQQELSVSGGGEFGWSVALGEATGIAGALNGNDGFGGGALFALDEADTWVEQLPIAGSGTVAEAITGERIACEQGNAAGFPCQGVELLAYIPTDVLGSGADANDLWGWVDPETDREYALAGVDDGVSFVDVTDPLNPVVVGFLPRSTGSFVATWRDVKVYADHAFIVADNVGNQGMQVFDLTQLRAVTNPPVTFAETARYDGFDEAHNVIINEETGFAYAVGITGEPQPDPGCGAGLHMIDISDPINPEFAGCFLDPETGGRVAPGYIHDAQCVVYHGPDTDYFGRELCFNSSEFTLGIADVTDKANPVAISRATYPNAAYVHQGWLTDDHRYFLQDDELDETGGLAARTRTIVWDLADLDNPEVLTEYFGVSGSSDHNQYVRGNFVYQANYASGMRVLDISDMANPVEVAFFDTVPNTDNPGFSGAWTAYPFFPSGNIILSSSEAGLFVLNVTALKVATESNEVPTGMTLAAAYPNPFNPVTTVSLSIPATERVTVAVYDLLGRKVAMLHDGVLPTGAHTLSFDADGLKSGTYFIRATSRTTAQVRAVTLIK